MRRVGQTLVLLLAALTAVRCEYVQHHLQSCGDLRVDLVNSQQTRESVYLIADGEALGPRTLLASGESRRLERCVEKGDRERFLAARGGDFIGVVTCVVSKSRYEYDSTIASVVWGPTGFACTNW